jgi:eukaryotic-like serine/threonine-protein kinase
VHALRAGDPERIGDYTTLGRLGQGAMGTVFLARSPGGRQVAVKVVRAELADNDGFRERFHREVAAMRADADPDAPTPWLATEYVPAPTLQDVVAADGPLTAPRTRALAAGLAEALRAVHGAGLVHRDLKPANVLLAGDGPRVIDFGIAKALEGAALTATGMVVGTPGFLSPEQIEGRDVTPASDVFAFGAVLVFAATGEGPFGTGTLPALAYRVVHGEPNLDGLPDDLRSLVAGCLDRRPDARPTPAELLAAVGPGEWTAPPVPTRTHTMVAPAEPVVPRTADVGGTVFRVGGRVAAIVPFVFLSLVAAFCALVTVGMFVSQLVAGAVVMAAAFLLFGVPAAQSFWQLVRPRRWLEVSSAGLTVGRGSRSRQLPWPDLARARVVEDGQRPWLVVWPLPGVSRAGLGAMVNGGGLRAYPIGHGRSRRARGRELRELRAALAWHGRAVYDPSP